MSQIFSKIYKEDLWSHGSGLGSLEQTTRHYRAFLQAFLRKKKITSVVDAGCGDWQFSQLIDWGAINYSGYDVVPTLIDQLNQQKSTPSISFRLYSGDPEDLPPADLLILKDVLQHLSNEKVEKFLKVLPRYRYALITNCVYPPPELKDQVNRDIEEGDFRELDLLKPPFCLKAKRVYQFNSSNSNLRFQYHVWKLRLLKREWDAWKKDVLLVDNTQSAQL